MVAVAAGAKRRVNKEGGMDHLEILPISKAPVGKSGPGTISVRASRVMVGSAI